MATRKPEMDSLRAPIDSIDWQELAKRNAMRASNAIVALRRKGLYCLDQPITRPNNAKSLQRVQGSF